MSTSLPYPTHREPNWFERTTWADEAWQAAIKAYWMSDLRNPQIAQAAARQLEIARTHYRHTILSWFWKLIAPLRLGQCVPDEVALLLAEEWDLKTRAD